MSDKRKAAFSKREETIIRDGYVEFKHVIEAPLSAKVTKSIKDDVWTTITNRVNAEAVGVKRTPAEINKKLKNMKYVVKDKISKERKSVQKTGGGPPDEKVIT